MTSRNRLEAGHPAASQVVIAASRQEARICNDAGFRSGVFCFLLAARFDQRE
jgi:hypothetical protein